MIIVIKGDESEIIARITALGDSDPERALEAHGYDPTSTDYEIKE